MAQGYSKIFFLVGLGFNTYLDMARLTRWMFFDYKKERAFEYPLDRDDGINGFQP
jgi:hypothetical protein